ncbi:MAG: DNA replication terminus site-binding protein [Natronospirillum sp.]
MSRQLTYLFDDWLAITRRLRELLRQDIPQSWMHGTSHLNETIRRLGDALTDVWYLDGQDGRATRRHIGVAKVGPQTMSLLARNNVLRARFHAELLKVKQDSPDMWLETSTRLARRARAVQGNLEDEGLVRLHLKQFSRTIPLLTERPEKISFNWYRSGRSIKRMTRNQVLEKLESYGVDKPHIAIQYQKVASLPDNEPLAQVQDQAPLVRANLRYEGKRREAFNVAMPIFIPLEEHGGYSFPEIVPPTDKPPEGRSRARRSDQKLEDEPFVSTLRVYRYRPV